jgi:hypothetical protein
MMNLYGRVFTPLQTAHVHVLAYPYECSALSVLDAIATGAEAARGHVILLGCPQQHSSCPHCPHIELRVHRDHKARLMHSLLQGRAMRRWHRRRSCCSRAS